jgi:signal transduction histidine kinase
MRTIVTKRLTPAYLRKLSRQNRVVVALAALTVIVSMLWMIFRLGGTEVTALFADVMYGLTALVGAWGALLTAYRCRWGPLKVEPRCQLAWLLVGTGMLLDGIGGLYYAYLEYSGQLNPVPSLADLCFILDDLCLVMGQLCILSGFRPKYLHLLVLLDSLITTLCLLGASWFFFISSIYLDLHYNLEGLGEFIVTLIYPFLDLLVIFSLAMLLTLYRMERPLRISLSLLAVGVVAMIWSDSWYGHLLAVGTYVSGTPYVDPGWFIFAWLVALAALFQYRSLAGAAYEARTQLRAVAAAVPAAATQETEALLSGEYSHRRALIWQGLIIYLPFIVQMGLTLYAGLVHDGTRAFLLDVLTALVAMGLFARYLLTERQNVSLLREREQRRQEAERLRLLTARLSDSLELNPLLERIVTLAATALQFDAALLLVQEAVLCPELPAGLKVYAAAAPGGEVNRWRCAGSHLEACAVLQERELELLWSEVDLAHLPPEVAAWQQREQLRVGFFVPLIYQEKHLGSLGFCRRRDTYCDALERIAARTFAEQAAAALEHAYLYQEAREQEAFAQALANMATRLNAAIVEPTELHQMICREGAKALDADYVLLYTPTEGGRLVPQAIAVAATEPATSLSEWPVIYEHEYEARALTSPHPILLPLTQFSQLAEGKPVTVAVGSGPAAHYALSLPRKQRMHLELSLREMMARRFVPTMVLAPLFSRSEPVGLLILARSLHPGTQDKQPFGLPDLPRAQGFAEQAAVAYTNATLYRQLRTAHQQLQELDQLKDQFMITASHELRTPLTAVQGYLELLAQYDDSLPAEQRREFLHKTRVACDELVLLLNNVMDASRLEVDAGIRPAHIETVSVEDIVQSVLDMIEPQLTQEERLVYMDIASDLAVRADPVRLRQILRNLAMNALKYSPPGSPITFRARATLDGPVLAPCALISVTDRGKGIPPADQPRLFQRFVRLESDVNSPVRGSGLGLYISRRLVEAMKGKIWVESRGVPGEGSTFYIQLPLAYLPG